MAYLAHFCITPPCTGFCPSSIQSQLLLVPIKPVVSETHCLCIPVGIWNNVCCPRPSDFRSIFPQGILSVASLQRPLTRSITLCQIGAAPVIPITFCPNGSSLALPVHTPTTTSGV